jgi:hypothetical protein
MAEIAPSWGVHTFFGDRFMKRNKRTFLELEKLEDRWVPANVQFVSGYLIISPSPGEAALKLTLKQTAANTFSVTDQGKSLGTFGPVGNLLITGGNGADSVTIDVNGKGYTGNIFANTGNGNDTIDVTNTSGTAGSVGGNITLLPGLGDDSVSISSASAGVLHIGGTVQNIDMAGNDSFTFGNGSASTTVGGDLSILGTNNIQIDQGSNDLVGGNINVNQAAHGGHLFLEQGLVSGTESITIGRNFNISSNQLSADVFLRGMSLGGNLNVQLGNGVGPDVAFGQLGNFLGLSSSPSTVTVINGNFNYTSGSGNDSLDLGSGVINGNVGITVGDGNVNISLETFTTPTIIGGNLTINAGNGNDLIGPLAGDGGNQALINGNVFINLGNGTDTTSFAAGGSVGGMIFYHSGNGNDSVMLAGAQTYNVFVLFGNGDDTFTLNNAAAVLTGLVDGGGHITANVFNPVAGTIGSPFTQLNFP